MRLAGEHRQVKILQAISFFSLETGGGVIASVQGLARALVRDGHEVTLLTTDFRLDEAYLATLGGVNLVVLRNYFSFADRPGLVPSVIPWLERELGRYDVIHLHEIRSFICLALYHAARKQGVPYIIDAHGGAIPKTYVTMKRFLDALYGRRILRYAAQVVSETEHGIDEYRRQGVPREKISVIYPPFPMELPESLEPGSFRKRYGIGDERIVAFMGRINKIKRLDFLIDAFARLSASKPDVVLVIIGADDGDQHRLKRQAASLGIARKVIFTGFLAGAAKEAALGDIDLMVIPSEYEQGLPRPAIEALLRWKPVILCRGTGAAVMADQLSAAYLVGFGNVDELAMQMEFVLDNHAEVKVGLTKSRVNVINELSPENGVKQYTALYQRCIRSQDHLDK